MKTRGYSERSIRIIFVVALLILVFVSTLFFWSRTQLIEDQNEVAHTYEVIVSLEDTLSTLKDAETGQRGFVITGDSSYLEPYQDALTSLGPKIDSLRVLVAGSSTQTQHLADLQTRIDQKLAELKHTIDLRTTSGFEAAAQSVMTNQGQQLMTESRQVVESMETQARNLLLRRQQTSQRSTQVTDVISLAAGLLSFSLIISAFTLLTRALLQRKRAESDIHALNNTLESRVQARTHELSVANESLASEILERKQIEDAERLQREWLQITLTSIGDAVLATDNESRITFLNPHAETLTGWSQAEAKGKDVQRVFNIINEQTRQPAMNPIERVLREGIVVGLANHTVLIGKDGTEVPIDDSGAPIRNMSGDTIGAILVFRDVTEQRGGQRIQSRLAAIVESSEDAIIGKDLDGIITSWNKGAEHMYGYTAEETVGKPISLLIPTTWTNDVPAILERIKRGEKVEHYETKRMRKDGKVLDVSLTVSPIRDSDGTIIGASKIARDITEQKLQEQTLTRLYETEQQARDAAEKANQQLAFLSHASQLLSSSLDYDTTFKNLKVLMLPELADIYAIDVLQEDQTLLRVAVAAVEPILETWITQLEARSNSRALLENAAFAGGQSIYYEKIPQALFESFAQDEDHLALLRNIDATSEIIVPLRIRETIMGILTVVRRNLSPAYTKNDVVLIEELGHRIAQTIDNTRLYAEAEKAIDLRNEFLSVAAHELKTPLTSLRGFAQTLTNQLSQTDSLEPERFRRGLARIDEQSRKLTVLINRLLEISRIESGRLILERQQTDIAALVKNIVDQTTTDKHEIILQIEPSLMGFIDPLRVEQVVINLLDNAIKYSPDGGPINIDVVRLDNDTIQLTVSDQGLGVHPERRDKLFERFYQAHHEGYAGGMGLGLYISRQIVELHGGQIYAEFPTEGGTRFIIALPSE